MQQKILEAFLYNKKLKFNEIEKITKIRSNKLAYYLKKLKKKEILTKQKDSYKLSETAEQLVPYINNKKATLCVVLIAIKNKEKIFLYNRQKRPFKNKLSLPGGRLLAGEKINEAVKRIMKEKFNINAKFKKINSISLEHVKNKSKKVYSFLLILITASTKNKIKCTEIEKNKDKIIPSDYKLIKNDLDKEVKIKTLITLN